MANLSEKLSDAVQAGDEKKVRELCGRLEKGRTGFSPVGSVPPGNRVFLDKTYMRFSQKSSREAVVLEASGQGWVINGPADVVRALYGSPPVEAPPESPPEPEVTEEEPTEPAVEEPEGPLGPTEVTKYGPGDAKD